MQAKCQCTHNKNIFLKKEKKEAKSWKTGPKQNTQGSFYLWLWKDQPLLKDSPRLNSGVNKTGQEVWLENCWPSSRGGMLSQGPALGGENRQVWASQAPSRRKSSCQAWDFGVLFCVHCFSQAHPSLPILALQNRMVGVNFTVGAMVTGLSVRWVSRATRGLGGRPPQLCSPGTLPTQPKQ